MADPKPFRLVVLERLTAQLQTISRTTGPYLYDLAVSEEFPDGKVLRGRGAYGTNDPLPMLSIIEDPKQLEQMAVPEFADAAEGDWDLLIQGFLKDDPVHPTDPAYYLLGDTKNKLFEVASRKRDILGLGAKKPMVEKLFIGSGVVRPPDDISATSYFWLPLRLRLMENAADAFLF